MLAWMAYAVAVSLLLAGAALAAEKALDLYRGPTRWPWAAALVGSVAVPLVAYLVSGGWLSGPGPGAAAPGGAAGGAGLPVLPFLGAELAEAGSAGLLADGAASLDPWLLGGCLAASLAVGGWLMAGWVRLRFSRRDWRRLRLGGLTVMISPNDGPAVTGVLRGTILLPAWFEELDRDLQRLVLRHEREHLSSGDHRMWALGLATLVLSPWNPVLWWGLSRLRQSMEIDCDRRVLARGVSRATYGELLVQAGRRATAGSRLSPAAFAASPSLLERRIRRLADPVPDGRSSRAAMAVGVVAAMGLAGGWLPAPSGTVTVGPAGDAEGPQADAPPAVSAADARPGSEPAGARARRVVPPVPAVMRFDLRLYRAPRSDGGATAESGRELDIEAVRLARRLSYGCTPYLGARAREGGDGGSTPSGSPGGPGCLVVMDGRRVEPSAVWELGPGAIERIDILPAEEATERFGPDGRRGAYLIRTERG